MRCRQDIQDSYTLQSYRALLLPLLYPLMTGIEDYVSHRSGSGAVIGWEELRGPNGQI